VNERKKQFLKIDSFKLNTSSSLALFCLYREKAAQNAKVSRSPVVTKAINDCSALRSKMFRRTKAPKRKQQKSALNHDVDCRRIVTFELPDTEQLEKSCSSAESTQFGNRIAGQKAKRMRNKRFER
jgi:hypothetical protein